MTARRLAAILVADVVGYSKLIGEDEAGTLTSLKERFRRSTVGGSSRSWETGREERKPLLCQYGRR
jgi:class 3 adenylate cyclase